MCCLKYKHKNVFFLNYCSNLKITIQIKSYEAIIMYMKGQPSKSEPHRTTDCFLVLVIYRPAQKTFRTI